jgi:glycosyltransferase involved in cell wall biosynthesis
MRILFLATYFPRPLNPTIGTWALEQAKAFARKAESRNSALDAGRSPLVSSFRVVSGNPWFPKLTGKLKAGIRVYSECPRKHAWDGVEVDYLPMLFYPFGKLDAIFNRVGEPMLRLGWWSIKGRLMKIVEEFQPDVVYAHHTVPNGYFAFRIHKLTGIPFVVTDHEMGEITACEVFPARKAVYEKVVEAAQRMVSVAGVMRRDMERVFPQARCEVIHNGMNLTQAPKESRGESRETRAAPASTPATRNSLPTNAPEVLKSSTLDSGRSTPLIILSCGMFYARKNFSGLIQAFNLVAEKNPNVVLRIFGDGPDRLKVENERYHSPFRERIELLGKVDHAEVLEQMQGADFFALIGWREPFATVFLEAMAAGLPVIACNDGGIAEVIHSVDLSRASSVERSVHDGGFQISYGAESETALDSGPSTLDPSYANGILVPPRNIEAAARALEFLILNPEARKQIGTAARQKIESDLTWDEVTNKYLCLFHNACNGKQTVG